MQSRPRDYSFSQLSRGKQQRKRQYFDRKKRECISDGSGFAKFFRSHRRRRRIVGQKYSPGYNLNWWLLCRISPAVGERASPFFTITFLSMNKDPLIQRKLIKKANQFFWGHLSFKQPGLKEKPQVFFWIIFQYVFKTKWRFKQFQKKTTFIVKNLRQATGFPRILISHPKYFVHTIFGACSRLISGKLLRANNLCFARK